MAIITNITPLDAAVHITNGIKATIEREIEKELLDYITPQIKTIARYQAERVCKEAVLHFDKDVISGEVKVMVVFKEQP